MTISTGYIPDFYDGDDTEDTFVFSWRILLKADLVAKVLTVATGAVVTLALGSDYTIADSWVDNPSGGAIVLTDPLATGDRLWLIRDTAKTQLVNITEGSPFPAATVTKVFDRLTMMVQELIYLSRQALKFAATSTFKDVDVPDPVDVTFLSWLNDVLINAEVGDSFVGAELSVTQSASTKAVVFAVTQADTNYEIVSISTNWQTSYAWSAKTTSGFTITFANPAPASAKVVYRIKAA